MALDPHARVLHLELVQHVEEPLLVALLLRLDRDRMHRRREFERAQANVVLVVRVVQDGVEFHLVDLRDGADVAGHERIDLHVFLALELEEVPDLEGALAVADEELRVLADRALVHAEHSDLADVRDP
jgi:hypothetical protein